MTVARRLLPGQAHAITRRCAGRRFLLKPVPQVNAVVRYALGLALSRCPGISLHALMVEASHIHAVCSDAPTGASQLPRFLGLFHSLVARALNSHWHRGENFWRAGSYSNVEIWDDPRARPTVESSLNSGAPSSLTPTLDAQLLYVWTQAVRDGLVATPAAWPGVSLGPEDFGRTVVVPKPESAFFGGRRPADWEPTDPAARARHRREQRRQREAERRRQKARDRRRGRSARRSRHLARERRRQERVAGPRRQPRLTLPDTVSIAVTPPPGYEDWPVQAVRTHFRSLLDVELERIHAQRQEAGLTGFMGVEAILAQSPFASSGPTAPDFGLDPRVACKLARQRVRVLKALVAWRETYREAYLAWRAGHRGVRFPTGSYGIPCFHGALVADPSRAPPDSHA